MDQSTPDAAPPDRRLLDLVAVVLMLLGWAGLGATFWAVHPLLAAAYGSVSFIVAGVALGTSR